MLELADAQGGVTVNGEREAVLNVGIAGVVRHYHRHVEVSAGRGLQLGDESLDPRLQVARRTELAERGRREQLLELVEAHRDTRSRIHRRILSGIPRAWLTDEF